MLKIIKKLDRFINPSKYYRNDSVKPIDKLCNGDKLYILVIPNLEHIPIHGRVDALKSVLVTSCEILGVLQDKRHFDAIMLFDKRYDELIRTHYFGERDYEILSTKQMALKMSFTKPKNETKTKTLQLDNNDKIIYLTTDKNVIINHLKSFFNAVKICVLYSVKEREGLVQKLTPTVYEGPILTKEELLEMNAEHIARFKQQYNKIIYKLKTI